MSSSLANPYRPFFFVGTIAAIVGTGVWIPHLFWELGPYPGRLHAQLMMGLFLMSFAMGFLMTALPRMTQSYPTQRYEFVVASLSLGILAALGFTDPSGKSFFLGIVLNATFLFFFAARRVLARKQNLPEIFPLVLWGLSSALLGATLCLLDENSIGERLLYLNFMLCLVLGVGMRLIPTILRLPARREKWKTWHFTLIGAALTSSVFFEIYGDDHIGSYLRAILVSLIAVRGWRLFDRGGSLQGLSIGLRIAAFSVLLGTWALALYPEYRLEALHVIYVMGFSLMTFLVATRVILAHGNYGVENEIKNLYIRLPLFLILLAGLTRVAAIFIPGSYERHLAYAAVSFVIGVSIWAKYFLPRVFENFGQLEK